MVDRGAIGVITTSGDATASSGRAREPAAAPRRWLSDLDESGMFGPGWTVASACGARVELRGPAGGRSSFLDFMTAYGAVNFGHCHPALEGGALEVDIVGGLYTAEAEELAGWLCHSTGLPDHEVLFQVGGSFAVSTALALAHQARPGRPAALAGAFHGLGVDAQAVTDVQTGMALQRTAWARLAEDAVVRLRPGDPEPDWSGISAFLFEPIQGANGYVPVDRGWLCDTVRSAQAAGVCVIADEVQSGYYRHGHLSVARAWGLTPDVLLFSKSLTNGAYPLSAVLFSGGLVPQERRGLRLSHTFQTGAAGFAAAMRVARFLDREPVEAMCAEVEEALEAAAAQLRDLGAEGCHVTGPSLSFDAGSPAMAKALVHGCFDRRLLIFTGGSRGERIRVAPPVVIGGDELNDGLLVLVDAWRELCAADSGPA